MATPAGQGLLPGFRPADLTPTQHHSPTIGPCIWPKASMHGPICWWMWVGLWAWPGAADHTWTRARPREVLSAQAVVMWHGPMACCMAAQTMHHVGLSAGVLRGSRLLGPGWRAASLLVLCCWHSLVWFLLAILLLLMLLFVLLILLTWLLAMLVLLLLRLLM